MDKSMVDKAIDNSNSTYQTTPWIEILERNSDWRRIPVVTKAAIEDRLTQNITYNDLKSDFNENPGIFDKQFVNLCGRTGTWTAVCWPQSSRLPHPSAAPNPPAVVPECPSDHRSYISETAP